MKKILLSIALLALLTSPRVITGNDEYENINNFIGSEKNLINYKVATINLYKEHHIKHFKNGKYNFIVKADLNQDEKLEYFVSLHRIDNNSSAILIITNFQEKKFTLIEFDINVLALRLPETIEPGVEVALTLGTEEAGLLIYQNGKYFFIPYKIDY